MTTPNTTPTVAPVAKEKEKNKQLAASVPLSLHAAFQDAQWTLKKKPSDMVREAVEEYAAKHNFLPENYGK